MTKRNEHGEEARELYVVHGLTLREIAVKLSVGERTLSNWKRDDEKRGMSWEDQRALLAGAEGGLHAELHRLATVIARKMREDLEKPGGQVDDRVYLLDKILASALKSHKIEQNTKPPDKDKRTPEERRQAAAAQLREAFGL